MELAIVKIPTCSTTTTSHTSYRVGQRGDWLRQHGDRHDAAIRDTRPNTPATSGRAGSRRALRPGGAVTGIGAVARSLGGFAARDPSRSGAGTSMATCGLAGTPPALAPRT